MRHYSRAEMERVFDHVLGKRLAGMPEQDILEEVTSPRYEIGSRLQLPAPDGRVFHYCHSSAAVGCASQHGCSVRSDRVFQGDGAQPAIPISSRRVTVTLQAGEVVTVNQLAGGLFGGYSDRGVYHIVSNEASVVGPPVSVVITIARPTYRAMGGGANRLYLYPNIYSECMWPDVSRLHLQGWSTVVAFTLIDVAADRYFWGQTWGKVLMINGTWGANIGQTVNRREVHFDWDGNIVQRDGDVVADAWMQRAGYLMWDGNEATGGDQYVFLQLDP